MLLLEVARTSAEVSATSSRRAKTALVAALLRAAGPEDAAVVAVWLSGELPQRRVGVGWAALRSLPPPAAAPSLDVATTDRALSDLAAVVGPGAQAARRSGVAALFGAATAPEQAFLRALLSGELRQGALGGVVLEGVAQAAEVPPAAVRRAVAVADLPDVARAVLSSGADGLAAFALQVGRPVGPMLAQTADGVGTALERLGGSAAFEAKLDGARVQVHRDGDEVRVWTRTLDDVTARLPEVVDAALAWGVTTAVVDGEAIALRPDGRPEPFQVTAARFGTSVDVMAARAARPLSVVLFDLLHLDGRDLLDEPGRRRRRLLEQVVPADQVVDRIETDDVAVAQAFLDATLAAGHEGVVVKALDAPYEAGRRGAGWLKVKPVHTLDLVVLAVEHGSGRRTGTLSNIHLGARDPAAGGFVMVGKTFKGMTDAMLAWQTTRFQELATDDDGWVVTVRPEQVVEVAVDGVQRSSRYPGGVALRFARVVRYRDDKAAAEADTIEAVRALGAP